MFFHIIPQQCVT